MQGRTTPPAVILGGIGSTVTLVRSLGRHGVPVHVLGAGAQTLATASRFCHASFDVGGGPGLHERWWRWLEEEGPAGAVLLPSGDDGVEFLVAYRDRLEEAGFHLPPTAGDVSLAMLDKARTYALAREVGVPCPRTWTVSTEADVAAIAGELPYPCALKPLNSHLFAAHFPGIKLFTADDESQLLDSLRLTAEAGVEMLVTEIVKGPEHFTWTYSAFLDDDGRPLFGLTRNKLRSEPVHFGTNCFVVTRRNAAVEELGLAFLQGVGMRGLAHVEFKWDATDGTYKLIECNHRFVNAQEVIRRAGLDFAVLVYRRALGEDIGAPPPWREGVRLWWPERDLKAALAYRREGSLTLRQWVRSLMHAPIYSPRFAVDDPGPTALMGARRLQRLLQRLR